MQVMIYPFQKKEVNYASILCEMQNQEGDERRQGHNNEERETGNSRRVPSVWHKDVPNRKELRSIS